MLSKLSLSYPKVEWVCRDPHLRSEEQRVSLSGLRLQAEGQQVAVDATKDDERVDAHLALAKLRLDLLRAWLPRATSIWGEPSTSTSRRPAS